MADGKRRALDLLTAGQGERVYLKEECCFYVSWSGQVSTSILKHPQIHGKDRTHWCWHSCQQMTMVVTILLLLLVILLMLLFILLLLGPLLLNHLVQFVSSRIQAIHLQMAFQRRYHPI